MEQDPNLKDSMSNENTEILNSISNMAEKPIKKQKKKLSIILCIIVLIVIATIALVLIPNKENKENKENKNSDKKDDISLIEAKEYLKDNWDKINIDGSTSMIPLHESLNKVFGSEDKEVEHSKTVDAFEKLISGENDILLGVTYSDELLTKAKNNNVNLVSKEITREGFIFLVNANNPVKSLTVQQIKDIYSGKIKNWKEVGGNNVPIKAYQRNDDSGSQIRMNKFMGNTKLMNKTYTAGGMGELIIYIAGFDDPFDDHTNAIGYNMYTFTEKQFDNDDSIKLLQINGIQPNDNTIFDETYPIIIYNYLYYNKNNPEATKFANNLYVYLMSDEGQKLISDSGYVNLNKKFDRNKDINIPYDEDEDSYKSYYNKEKGEFYDVDDNGNIIVYKNYADFILDGTNYKNNQNARDFLTTLFNSNIITSNISVYDKESSISINRYWFDASFDPEDLFNIRYNNLYYSDLVYYINENKYFLKASDKEAVKSYENEGYLKEFPSKNIATKDLQITKEELKNVYLREPEMEESFSDIKYIKLK